MRRTLSARTALAHDARCKTPPLTAPQVSYYYDSDVGDYYYGMSHPMKPHRVRMCHDLIVRYGLYKQLQVRVSACSAALRQLQCFSACWGALRSQLPLLTAAAGARVRVLRCAVAAAE